MSYYADLCHTIKTQLNKYDESQHKAIVETFAECVGDWPDDEFKAIIINGYGISREADKEIIVSLHAMGIDTEDAL